MRCEEFYKEQLCSKTKKTIAELIVVFHLFQQGKSGGGLREKPDADDNSTAEFVSKPRTEGNHTQICRPAAFQRQAQPSEAALC